MQYRLRTLLIVLAVLPPMLAWIAPPLVALLRARPAKAEMDLLLAGEGMRRLSIERMEIEFQKAMSAGEEPPVH